MGAHHCQNGYENSACIIFESWLWQYCVAIVKWNNEAQFLLTNKYSCVALPKWCMHWYTKKWHRHKNCTLRASSMHWNSRNKYWYVIIVIFKTNTLCMEKYRMLKSMIVSSSIWLLCLIERNCNHWAWHSAPTLPHLPLMLFQWWDGSWILECLKIGDSRGVTGTVEGISYGRSLMWQSPPSVCESRCWVTVRPEPQVVVGVLAVELVSSLTPE